MAASGAFQRLLRGRSRLMRREPRRAAARPATARKLPASDAAVRCPGRMRARETCCHPSRPPHRGTVSAAPAPCARRDGRREAGRGRDRAETVNLAAGRRRRSAAPGARSEHAPRSGARAAVAQGVARSRRRPLWGTCGARARPRPCRPRSDARTGLARCDLRRLSGAVGGMGGRTSSCGDAQDACCGCWLLWRTVCAAA